MLLTGFFFIGICGAQRLIAEDLLFKEFILLARGRFALVVRFPFFISLCSKNRNSTKKSKYNRDFFIRIARLALFFNILG